MGFCAKSPCLNNGTCFNVDNDYECKCKPDFDGRNCEKVKDLCTQREKSCQGILRQKMFFMKNVFFSKIVWSISYGWIE